MRRRAHVLRIAVVVVAASIWPASAVASVSPQPVPLFRLPHPPLAEVSGIAADPAGGIYYLHQDAGRPGVVHVLDERGGVRARLLVPSPNEDWEDVTAGTTRSGRPVLYLADTGDDSVRRGRLGLPGRREFAVVRIDRPDVRAVAPDTALRARGAIRYRFAFEDGKAYNSETLLVQPGTERVLVVDKAPVGRKAHLWAGPAVPRPGVVNTFRKVAQIPVTLASGGAFSTDGERIVVRDGTTAHVWHVGDDLAQALRERPVLVVLPQQPQGEGVTFSADGTSLVVAGEGGGSMVWRVPLPDAAQAPGAPTTPAAEAQTTPPSPPVERTDDRTPLAAGLAVGGIVVAAAVLLAVRRRRPERSTGS